MISTTSYVLLAVLLLGTVFEVLGQEPKVGQPQFSLEAAGGGNNKRNWNAGFQAGVGTKVWESKNKKQSFEVGGTYGRGFVRHEGKTYKSEPSFGIRGTYRFGRK